MAPKRTADGWGQGERCADAAVAAGHYALRAVTVTRLQDGYEVSLVPRLLRLPCRHRRQHQILEIEAEIGQR